MELKSATLHYQVLLHLLTPVGVKIEISCIVSVLETSKYTIKLSVESDMAFIVNIL
jgi:hypothetical protein